MDWRDGGARRVGVVVLVTVADLVDGEDDGGDDEQQPDDPTARRASSCQHLA